MTEPEPVSADSSYPPAALTINDLTPAPLDEIVSVPQEGSKPASYWFSGGGRSLFAEAQDGRWCRIEYVFPVGSRLFELRWAENRAPRLWSADRELHDNDPTRALHLPRQTELTFPAVEIQQLELVMHNVPHSLWSRLIKLALDAHFVEAPFPQRARERPPERRRRPRAHS